MCRTRDMLSVASLGLALIMGCTQQGDPVSESTTKCDEVRVPISLYEKTSLGVSADELIKSSATTYEETFYYKDGTPATVDLRLDYTGGDIYFVQSKYAGSNDDTQASDQDASCEDYVAINMDVSVSSSDGKTNLSSSAEMKSSTPFEASMNLYLDSDLFADQTGADLFGTDDQYDNAPYLYISIQKTASPHQAAGNLYFDSDLFHDQTGADVFGNTDYADDRDEPSIDLQKTASPHQTVLSLTFDSDLFLDQTSADVFGSTDSLDDASYQSDDVNGWLQP